MTPVSCTQPINNNHVFIFFFSFGQMISDIQILMNSSWKIFATFWRLYHSFCHIVLNIAFALKLANYFWFRYTDMAQELELICHIFYAIATIDTLVGSLYWFQLHSKMGPLIIQLSHIITDFGTMVLVWIIVYFAFIYGIFFLVFGSSDNFDYQDTAKANNYLYSTLFWSILNPGPVEIPDFSPENVTYYNGTGGGEVEDTETMLLRIWVASFAFACYQIVAVILLLNLVIAAMNTTITKLEMSKETNWR